MSRVWGRQGDCRGLAGSRTGWAGGRRIPGLVELQGADCPRGCSEQDTGAQVWGPRGQVRRLLPSSAGAAVTEGHRSGGLSGRR